MCCSFDSNVVNKDMPQITLGKGPIGLVNKFKYLVITFDPNFKEQADFIVKRRVKGLNAMKVMAGAQMEQRLLLMLYKALIFSVLGYGCELITIKNS